MRIVSISNAPGILGETIVFLDVPETDIRVRHNNRPDQKKGLPKKGKHRRPRVNLHNK